MEAAAGGKRAYSIIVPTYNERLNVALIVYLIFKHLPDVNFEIIVVDDGSPDGTQDIVKQLQQIYGEDRVVSIFEILKYAPDQLEVFVYVVFFFCWYHGLIHCLRYDTMPVTAS